MGVLLVFGLFYVSCAVALICPWIGITAFYGFYFLNPEWNWRFEMARDSGFQKWLLICTLVGFLIQGLQGQRFRNPVLLGLLGIMGYLGVSYISAGQSIDRVLSDFYMQSIWKVILTACLAIRLLDSPRKLLVFMWVIVLAHAYNSYQLNKSYFDVGFCIYVYRRDWAWTGSNQWSNKSLCVSSVAIALVFFSRFKWQSLLAGALTLLMLHEIMFLESRGVMIGMLVTGLVFYCFLPKTSINNLMVFVGVLGVFFLAGPSVLNEFQSSFSGIEEIDASASSRFDLWKAGFRIMMDYPLLGVGPYAGSRLVPLYAGLDGDNKGLHNLWFEIACGSGIFAALLYFTFFGSIIYSSWIVLRNRVLKSKPEERAAAMASLAGLLGFLACNMFSAGALIEGSYVLCILGASSFLILQQRMDEKSFQTESEGFSLEEDFQMHDNDEDLIADEIESEYRLTNF